jgi:Fe-S-cluster containining protein
MIMDLAQPILDRLTELYDRMDQAYSQTARHYGFTCTGCQDNCCQTLFHHHTYVECLHLVAGLNSLKTAKQQILKKKAAQVRLQTQEAIGNGNSAPRILCPLNEAGRCVLYAHRPMICRLHGVPHLLRRPDDRVQIGPGCADFQTRCKAKPEAPLDRTPLYRSMATIENQLRSQFALSKKIRVTVADMVLCEDPLNQ